MRQPTLDQCPVIRAVETVDDFAALADEFVSTASAPGKQRECLAQRFRVTRAYSDGWNQSESFTE